MGARIWIYKEMLGYSPGCNKDKRVPSALSHKLEKGKIQRLRRDLHPSPKKGWYTQASALAGWARDRTRKTDESTGLAKELSYANHYHCGNYFVDFEAIAYNFCLSISLFSSILRSIVSYIANNLKPTSDFIGQDDEVAWKRHWVSVIMLNWKTASLFALRQMVTRAFYAKRRFLHSSGKSVPSQDSR